MSDLNLTSFNPLYPMRIHPYKELLNDSNVNIMDKVNAVIDYLNQVGKLTNDVVKDWNTVYQWVMNDGLTTDVNNKIEEMKANGELQSLLNTIFNTLTGDMTTLHTTAKDTIVNALNEIDDLAKGNQTQLAQIATLAPKPSGADDTTAIQNIINSLSSKGGIILLSQGTYLINNPLTSIDNVTFIGENTTLSGDPTKTIINVGNNNVFDNITFTNCSLGINSNGKNKLKITKCQFVSNANSGIELYDTTDSMVLQSYFNNIPISSIVINGNSDNILIQGNTFTNPSLYGGYASEQISAHVYCLSGNDIRVIGNRCFNNGGEGIIFAWNNSTGKGVTNSKAIGNHCEGNGQEGITSFGNATGNSVTNNNIIMGNTCKNNRFHQIEVWNSDFCTVEANIVDELSNTGNMAAICLYGSKGSAAINNKVLHARSAGIGAINGSNDCDIINNKIYNTNESNFSNEYQGNGILLDNNGGSNPYNIQVKNNTFNSSNGKTSTKSGVYSTANSNQNNDISGNTLIGGYKFEVHQFAIATRFDMKTDIPQDRRKWELGKICYNSSPNSSTTQGWFCITQGLAHKPSTGNLTYLSNQITNVTNIDTWQVGDAISSTQFAAGTTITAINGTTLTISNNAWTSITGISLYDAQFMPIGFKKEIHSGTITFSGDGAMTSKTIAHGCATIPTYYHVERASADAGTAGIKYITADATNLTVYFNTPPVSGTNNITLIWKAEA